MKRLFAFASAFALAGALAAVPAGAGTVVVKHKHKVTVEHVPGHTKMIMKVGPQGRFEHRGVWHDRIHVNAFVWPHGWRYHAIRIGGILPRIFIASDYYYDDYGPLGLQAPPPGYRWVRYGPDLLLINVRTGSVEDVVHDAFD